MTMGNLLIGLVMVIGVKLFGLSRQALSNRRSRNSVPYCEAVLVSDWTGISLDYLLAGNAPGIAP